jgi:hypothetical protein
MLLAFVCEDVEGRDPADVESVDDLAETLAAFRDARRRLAEAETVWEAELVASSETGMIAAGYELVHHWKGSTSDKWDRDGAFRAVLGRCEGELSKIVEWVPKVFRLEPRATQLRALRLDPDLYREKSTTGRMSVELKPVEQ